MVQTLLDFNLSVHMLQISLLLFLTFHSIGVIESIFFESHKTVFNKIKTFIHGSKTSTA